MSEMHYEMLSALDLSFLDVEDECAHMHIGSVCLFEAAPLCRADGTLDIERLRRVTLHMLDKQPRLRQKILEVPGHSPIWVDDPDFRLSYHLRHTALPLPGNERQLKRLAGRIMSQKLDRDRPLWELWLIEGVEDDRVGMVSKMHHCLADGISAGDMMGALIGPDPGYVPPPPEPWTPRPAPDRSALVRARIERRMQRPQDLLQKSVDLLRDADWRRGFPDLARGFAESAAASLGHVTPTMLNHGIGPHRRFDWTCHDFARVRAIKDRVGGKVNDVVLACVAGAIRSYFLREGEPVDGVDFRVLVPVNVRRQDEAGKLGNRVSNLSVPLPIGETSPGRRLRRVIETTTRAKASNQSQAGESLARLADAVGLSIPRGLARRAADRVAANMVVTNVPGSPVPTYFAGSKTLAAYPLVPLTHHQALGIALFSYAGGLHWGFNADWDRVPHLHEFALDIDRELDLIDKETMPIELSSGARA